MINYIVVDTETTGLPNYALKKWPKIVSIGIIHCALNNNELEIYSEKEFYVNNWVDEFEESTQKFLDISKEDVLKLGVDFNIVVNYINSLVYGLKNVVFVAHNAEFDKNVIKSCGLDLTRYTWLCTMKICYTICHKFPRLSELANYYRIPIELQKCHTALYDAQICAHILFAILTNSSNSRVYERRELNLRTRTVETFI